MQPGSSSFVAPRLEAQPASAALREVSKVVADRMVSQAELKRLIELSGGASGGAKTFLETVAATASAHFDYEQSVATQNQGLLKSVGRLLFTGTTKAAPPEQIEMAKAPMHTVAAGPTVHGTRDIAVLITFGRAQTASSAEQPQVAETVESMVKSGLPLADVLIHASVLDSGRKAHLLEGLAVSLSDPSDLRLAAAAAFEIREGAPRGKICGALAKNPNIEPDVASLLTDEWKRVNGTIYDAVTPDVMRDLLEGDSSAQERGLDAVKAAIQTFEKHMPGYGWSHGPRPAELTRAVYTAVSSAISVARFARVPVETLLSTPSVRRGLIELMRDLHAGRKIRSEPYDIIPDDHEQQWLVQCQDFAMTLEPGAPGAPKWLKAAQVWAQRQAPSVGELFLERHILERDPFAPSLHDPSRFFRPAVLERALADDKREWPPAQWTPLTVPKSLTDPASRGLFRAIDAVTAGVVHSAAKSDNGWVISSTINLLDGSKDPAHRADLEAAAPDIIAFFEQAGLRGELDLAATRPNLRLSGTLPPID